MRINWRRGFLRAWLVLAVVWIGAAGWIEYSSQVEGPWTDYQKDPLVSDLKQPAQPFDPDAWLRQHPEPTLWTRSVAAAPIVLGPPLIVLVLGLALGWIISGFGSSARRA